MKKRKISLINYGMGNLSSLRNAFNYLGTNVNIVGQAEQIERSAILILPGVGSFKKAMQIIKKKNIDEAINNSIKKGNYILGVCLGMQLLAKSSEEEKFTRGLKIINNSVKKFTLKETKNKSIPHVGFNSVNFNKNDKLYNGLKNNSEFYFVHSYRMLPEKNNKNFAITNYGINFLSSFNYDNIFATQFHPEKSQSNGIRLLKNFLDIT